MNVESMLTDLRYACQQLEPLTRFHVNQVSDRVTRALDALERIEEALLQPDDPEMDVLNQGLRDSQDNPEAVDNDTPF